MRDFVPVATADELTRLFELFFGAEDDSDARSRQVLVLDASDVVEVEADARGFIRVHHFARLSHHAVEAGRQVVVAALLLDV